MHFYESSIITTKDGLHCQVYGNEHPSQAIFVKPKYIPTEKVECNALPYRFISGKKMNRLNLWINQEELKKYIADFRKAYPQYIYKSPYHDHDRLFFAIPIDHIERISYPRRGLKELMEMPETMLDKHLKTVYHFVQFLLKSGLKISDLGITYSTLMGHYFNDISDINIVIYGKEKFWKLHEFLMTAKHPSLQWKTDKQWMEFYNKRNRFAIFPKEEFLQSMKRKKTEGYFEKTLFVLFATEKEEETWYTWGSEQYTSLGLATVQGRVKENHSSVVRPGCYTIDHTQIISSEKNLQVPVSKIVFYSRDYGMLAYPGEKIRACGILEKVKPARGSEYYRMVVGYFDAYLTERKEKEYITLVKEHAK